MNTNARKTVLASMVGLFAAGGMATATAQDSVGESARAQGVLDEIIVTSRMRKENLIDVPLTETVFNAQLIEDAGISQARDFINLTPNMSIVEQAAGSNSFLTIRGITQVLVGESPVAVVVDGVQQSDFRQFTQSLFDIESIEVVKGPQGALYGRNATGGAVIINTKRPTNEFEGAVRLNTGRGDKKLLQGSITGPLIEDTLLYSLSVRHDETDGAYNNTFLNERVDFNEEQSFRGRLIWNPLNNIEVDFRANIARQEGGALNYHYQPALLDSTEHFLIDANSFDSYDFSIGDYNLVDRVFRANNLGAHKRDIDEYSIKLDWDLGWATVTSTTAYANVFRQQSGDLFAYTADLATVFGGGGQAAFSDVETLSQEFRLTSNNDQAFRWQVGAYVLDTERERAEITSLDTGEGIIPISSIYPITDPRNPTQTLLGSKEEGLAWAVFGNIAYDLTDKLELAIAARYDEDDREQLVSPANTAGEPGALNKANFDAFQPKITARYKIEDNMSVFASWGKGFRSGQFNQNGISEIAAGLGIDGVSDVVPEEVTATSEVGYKGVHLDGRLRTNAAIFYTELEGGQVLLFEGRLSALIITAVDEVVVKGAEMDFSYAISNDFEIYGSYGFTDSEIKEYSLDPTSVGNSMAEVPQYTSNLGMQYRTPLMGSIHGFSRLDYERRGSQYGSPSNFSKRDPLNLVNIRLGVEDQSGDWSLVASVTNLTDEEYNSQYAGGFAYPAPPRLWSVEYTYNF